MPAYIKRNKTEILRDALKKVQDNTSITSLSPGSIARALTEAITTQIGDLYDIMDYNMNQNLLSTATGTALDMLGSLYQVERKTVNNFAALDKQLGSFMFYINTAIASDIVIPQGTKVFTDATSFIGVRHSFSTASKTVIPAGKTRAYVALVPNFSDTIFSAGANTLTKHDFQLSGQTILYCTNPKEIAQQLAFETDDAYRLRISKTIRVASSGTIEAARFAGLSISGVRDIRIRQNPYGMGSFEAIIVPEQNGDTLQIVNNARAAIESVRPLGVRMYVITPTAVSVDIAIDLIMTGGDIQPIAEQAIKRAEVGIRRYLNTLLPGNPIVYNRLMSVVLDSSDLVKDVIVKTFSVNGSETMRRNYQPAAHEQITPGNISISIASS